MKPMTNKNIKENMETHYACAPMVKKYGKNVKCCGCTKHGCGPEFAHEFKLPKPSHPLQDKHYNANIIVGAKEQSKLQDKQECKCESKPNNMFKMNFAYKAGEKIVCANCGKERYQPPSSVQEKEIKYKLIETAPVPYAPIGKGLAIVDIEMLQQAITKAEKRMIEEIEANLGIAKDYIGIYGDGFTTPMIVFMGLDQWNKLKKKLLNHKI